MKAHIDFLPKNWGSMHDPSHLLEQSKRSQKPLPNLAKSFSPPPLRRTKINASNFGLEKDATMRFKHQSVSAKWPTSVQYKHGFGCVPALIVAVHPSKQGKEDLVIPCFRGSTSSLEGLNFPFAVKWLTQNKGACFAMWLWTDLSISISFPIRNPATLIFRTVPTNAQRLRDEKAKRSSSYQQTP